MDGLRSQWRFLFLPHWIHSGYLFALTINTALVVFHSWSEVCSSKSLLSRWLSGIDAPQRFLSSTPVSSHRFPQSRVWHQYRLGCPLLKNGFPSVLYGNWSFRPSSLPRALVTPPPSTSHVTYLFLKTRWISDWPSKTYRKAREGAPDNIDDSRGVGCVQKKGNFAYNY